MVPEGLQSPFLYKLNKLTGIFFSFLFSSVFLVVFDRSFSGSDKIRTPMADTNWGGGSMQHSLL